jgi:TldD protein
VIADPDLAGVFAHEAVGHAAEGDSVVSGESILEKKIGEKVSSGFVTIYDDPAMENGFGSFPYDDEGVKGSKKILIENGVLKNFILSRETAFKLGMNPNGGARAESFAVRPLVRMSNTMIEKGEHSFDELIEDIKYGVYAKGTRGGQVDPAKGSFQFSAQEAFLIENGEVTKPLKDLSLSGLTLETLKNIDAVGKDVRFGEPGFCSKGQLVPVGDGGPHIRIKNVLIGGG